MDTARSRSTGAAVALVAAALLLVAVVLASAGEDSGLGRVRAALTVSATPSTPPSPAPLTPEEQAAADASTAAAADTARLLDDAERALAGGDPAAALPAYERAVERIAAVGAEQGRGELTARAEGVRARLLQTYDAAPGPSASPPG